MHRVLSRGFLPLALGTALFLGGCATKDDVLKAQSTADAANAAAGRAQQAADAARAAAQSANDLAQKASDDAKAANDKIDKDEAAEHRHGRRARGERG